MQWKRHARVIITFVLGVFAGVSLTTSVFPTLMSIIFEGYDSLSLLAALDPWAPYVAILWAILACIIGWYGGSMTGLASMGLAGLVSGLFFVLVAIPPISTFFYVAGTVIATTYGAVGGFLMGKFFVKP